MQKLDLDIHTIPEYAGLITDVDEKEFIGVLDSVREVGQIYPIIVNSSGVILDGHYRFRACTQLGVKPKYTVRDFPSKSHEFVFVADCALARKNLNTFRRTEVALKLKPHLERIAEANQKAGVEQTFGQGMGTSGVNKEIGKRANTSHETVRKSEKIIDSNNEPLIQDVRAGKKSINEGYREVTKTEKKKKLQDTKPIVNLPTEGFDLILGDFRNKCKDIPDNSIDLLFTDPPYNKESLSLYGSLAQIAARVLKPGASLIVYTAQHHLPEILKQMEVDGLRYWWIMAIKYTQSARLHGYHVFIGWKPLLWFVKGDKLATPEYISDIFTPEKPPDKIAHKWEQSLEEVNNIVSRLTEKNQVVLDPMLGSGTTGISALTLGRKFIGIEIDKTSLENAKKNIANSTG